MRAEILEKGKSPRGLSGLNIYPEKIFQTKAEVLELPREKAEPSLIEVVTGLVPAAMIL